MDIPPADAVLHYDRCPGTDTACFLVPLQVYSFHDSTGNVTEFWTKFYSARGLAGSGGEPGEKPGQVFRGTKVKSFGRAQEFCQAVVKILC